MKNTILLNGVQIKSPTDFDYRYYNITDSGRAASGRMNIDIIAKKRKFFFVYNIIDQYNFKQISDLIFGPEAIINLTYNDMNIKSEAKVYVGEISKTLHRTGAVWYYTNFKFNLIEQ